MIKLTKWDICAILERQIAKLQTTKKQLIKLKISTEEIDSSIREIQAIIENLSIDE